MLNFEEELEKFQPSMDIEKVEDVVYHNNLWKDILTFRLMQIL